MVAMVVACLLQGAWRVGGAGGEAADTVEADVEPAVEDGGDFVGGKCLDV
jgi:hypothetical protein